MGNQIGKATQRSVPWTVILAAVIYKNVVHLKSRGGGATTSVLEYVNSFVAGRNFSNTAAGDILGLIIVWRLFSLVSNLRFLRGITKKKITDFVGGIIYECLKMTPGASAKIEAETSKITADIEKDLKPADREIQTLLPTTGRADKEILTSMRAMMTKEDPKWKSGKVSGAVYHGEEAHLEVLNQAYAMFSVSNPLHPDVWPSVMKFEAEIVSMTAGFMNGGDPNVVGCVTSGGTESIFMSVKAHCQWGRKELGITTPEIIAPETVHAAFDKACEVLQARLIKVPVDKVTFKVSAAAMRSRISSSTVLLVGSAPSFPQGTIDPISELSDLAIKYSLGLHVDCCLGGFVLPFAKQAGHPIPDFDFGLPGVTAMSCDTHKYGYASKGTSVVLYRNKEWRHRQFFTFPAWTGGLYCTPTMAGSRPGALSAACWASMVRLGHDGYTRAANQIMETARVIREGVAAIPGLGLVGDAVVMVVAFRGVGGLNIYKVSDKMAHCGWSLNALQNPACVHMCVTLRQVQPGVAETFLRELRGAVEEVQAEMEAAAATGVKPKEEGSAPVYGMASSLPPGPVDAVLCSYMDVVLKP